MTIETESIKRIIKECNDINDFKKTDTYDEVDAAERIGLIRALRFMGFGIERDEHGYIVSVMKDGQIITE